MKLFIWAATNKTEKNCCVEGVGVILIGEVVWHVALSILHRHTISENENNGCYRHSFS